MKRSIIVLILFIGVALIAAPLAVRAWPDNNPVPTPSPIPIVIPDTDGDGINDEVDADPYTFNNRYVVIYQKDLPKDNIDSERIARETSQFFESEDIPTNNIITLVNEGATKDTFREAIIYVSERANKNDIFFLQINTHGYVGGIIWDILYAEIDQWLHEVDAGLIIIIIHACEADSALPILVGENRMVYVHTAGSFIGALGRYPEEAESADLNYGNGDGYVSIGEIFKYLSEDPMWGYIQSAEDYSAWPDVYLTDFNWKH